MNDKPIHQFDHFFEVGQKIVLIGSEYKKASLRDVQILARMYIVTEVPDKHRFKCKEWRKY